jgi:RNAse (barnase) inhibitor barstar
MSFYHRLSGPWLHVVELELPALTNRVLSLVTRESDTAVRVVRGRKMHSEARLFEEFAAALQFPYYFGENWEALCECMNDLSWMPAARYLIVMTDATQALREEREHFRTFLELLSDAGREWSEPGADTRPWAPEPRPFHVVVQSMGNETSLLLNLLTEAKVAHDAPVWA